MRCFAGAPTGADPFNSSDLPHSDGSLSHLLSVSYMAPTKRIVTANSPPSKQRGKGVQAVEIVAPIVTAGKPAKRQAPWADDGQPVP